jgi:predicted Zn-dependent peptidase
MSNIAVRSTLLTPRNLTEAMEYAKLIASSAIIPKSYQGKPSDIIVRELKSVLRGDVTEQEIDAAKSYMLGRYQMGAQTVSQISSFYTGRYFSDDVVRNYDDLPNRIRGISRDCIIDTAREFVRYNTNVFAGVSSGERKELVELNNKLATLFEQN